MANIVITGAARGIGLELVKLYAKRGDRIFAMVRSAKASPALKALAKGSGGKITIHKMDQRTDKSVAEGAASTGTGPVDILFNVAGVLGNVAPDLENIDWKTFDDTLNVMLKGPLRVLSAFLPRLKKGSKVINITSQLAASTWPYGGLYAYVAAKAGMNRLMRSVAIDLKDRDIVVGILHPGYVQTDMGGPTADITPLESATGIAATTDAWTLEQSGDFMKWNGEAHAW